MREVTGQPDTIPRSIQFQSTPPVREVTTEYVRTATDEEIFQSTPPVREVTSMERGIPPEQRISIHTSRAGGDG